MTHALLVLADGFEEIEAICVIDILRRANIHLVVAGLEDIDVTSCRGLNVTADSILANEMDHEFDIIILPGGEPGSTNLQNSDLVRQKLANQHAQNKWIAAICSAPRILAEMGILNGVRATSFPKVEPLLTDCLYEKKAVVIDKYIITGRGPGPAIKFSLAIVETLVGRKVASDIKKAMLFAER